jgi:hypothetical protein
MNSPAWKELSAQNEFQKFLAESANPLYLSVWLKIIAETPVPVKL